MSKECKQARNTVVITVIIVLGLLLFCSSCGSSNEIKKCCKNTVQEVYEYEGLTIE